LYAAGSPVMFILSPSIYLRFFFIRRRVIIKFVYRFKTLLISGDLKKLRNSDTIPERREEV
jgi:hypothetical protein